MPAKLLLPLFALAILLSACSSDRELPVEPPVAAVDSSLGSMGSSSSQSSIAMDDSEELMVGTMEYTADLSQSFIAFTGAKGDIIAHEGRFEDIDFSMTVTDGSPTDLFITFAIDSIVTDNEKLTTHLKSADFFDATTFPEATFIADSFVDSGKGMYAITGMFTMHGVTKKEIVTAKITSTYLTATHVLDRTDYGIGGTTEGLKAVDAAVPLEIKVVFN